MTYRIDYGQQQERPQKNHGIRKCILTSLFFLCFLHLVNVLWPEGRKMLRILLVPGDPDVTLHAVQVFASELEIGFSVTDAFRNLYITVLSHGSRG